MRMRRIILLPSACPSPQYYSALTHKRHDLGRREGGGGGKLLNTKYVFWFALQFLYETRLILRRIQRGINVHWSTCKVPAILVRLYWNLSFLQDF